MASKLYRRLTQKDQRNPSMVTGTGDSAQKAVKSLLKTLEAYITYRSPEKISEISERVETVWISVFDIENATAPQKKYELAEELLIRPDVMKLLLVAFRMVLIDVKRKIRDIYMLIVTWCSNDAQGSFVSRTRSKPKFNPKVRDLLYHCRFEVMEIVHEGYDMPASLGFYNDIIREFAKDDLCLTALLNDTGHDHRKVHRREEGCVWSVFERLMRNGDTRAFDVIVGTFETLEILFCTNHEAAHRFINGNLERFMQSFNKLIACFNFYVQARSLEFVYELFTAQQHYEIRIKWLAEPAFVKLIMLGLQNKKKEVRYKAINLLEVFVDNPQVSQDVFDFIGRNRIDLIKYCFDNAPIHYYQGHMNAEEDARLARIAHKLYYWNFPRPFSRPQMQEFEKDQNLQEIMLQEQTAPTRTQDYLPNVPMAKHRYQSKGITYPKNLHEPLIFGKPFGE